MFFQQLKNLCDNRGISVTYLVQSLGISKSNVTNWKNGVSPNLDVLNKIADYFMVSVDFLLGKTKNPLSVDEQLKKIGAIIPDKWTMVPILGEVRAGVGGMVREEIIGYEPFYAGEKNIDNCFMLRVKGNSMYPKYIENDLLMIKRQSSVDSGTFAVVIIDGEEAVVKKVIYNENIIELHSVNPMYPTRTFYNEDVLQILVIGKVIRTIREE